MSPPNPTLRRCRLTAFAFLLCAVPACSRTTPAVDTEADAAPAPGSALPAPASASVAAEPTASAPLEHEPIELLQFQFTSGVKNKEPVDRLDTAEPGIQVWAHLKLRQRSAEARVIHLTFKVNGETRTTLDLNVERSWSYRTWAYNTLRKTDKSGEITLVVTDDSGATLVEKGIPIQAKAVKKPLPK